MKLREYQKKLIDDLRQVFKEDPETKTAVAVLGCGGGKSVIQAELTKRFTDKSLKVLYLVHKKELIEQITDTFIKYGVDKNLFYAYNVKSYHKFKALEIEPDFILIDEAHTNYDAYKKIIANHNCIKIGFTATPTRLKEGDITDLEKGIFQKMVTSVTVRWLIDNNFLSDYKYFGLTKLEFEKMESEINKEIYDKNFSSRKKISQEQENQIFEKVATKFMNNEQIYHSAVDEWFKYTPNHKTMAYCLTREQSKKLVEIFNSRGITAEHLDGTINVKKREEIVSKYKKGEITVLSNVNLFSEGFDDKEITSVMLLRPTKSYCLHTQQAMRGMRYKEGKTAYILDFVKNYSRHGLPDAEYLDKIKESVECKKCNQVIDKGCSVCPHCGEGNVIENNDKECPRCNILVVLNAKKCPNCQYEFRTRSNSTPQTQVVMKSNELKLIDQQEFILKNKLSNKFYFPRTFDDLVDYMKHKQIKLGKIGVYCLKFDIVAQREDLEKVRQEQKFNPLWIDRQLEFIYKNS